jgi:DNA-binding response OmpR family regulator
MANKRILIIDDEPGICQVVQVAFKVITQWEVLVANSAQAGIAIAAAEQPDAILLDVMMPEVDGLSTVEMMRANSTIQHIPIILLTAKAQAKDREKFAQLPIAGVITKPFKAPTLVNQVRTILQWEK